MCVVVCVCACVLVLCASARCLLAKLCSKAYFAIHQGNDSVRPAFCIIIVSDFHGRSGGWYPFLLRLGVDSEDMGLRGKCYLLLFPAGAREVHTTFK